MFDMNKVSTTVKMAVLRSQIRHLKKEVSSYENKAREFEPDSLSYKAYMMYAESSKSILEDTEQLLDSILSPVETNWKKIKAMTEEELDELLSHDKIIIVREKEGVH